MHILGTPEISLIGGGRKYSELADICNGVVPSTSSEEQLAACKEILASMPEVYKQLQLCEGQARQCIDLYDSFPL